MPQFDRGIEKNLSNLEMQMMMEEIARHNKLVPDFVDPRQPYNDSPTAGQQNRTQQQLMDERNESRLRMYMPPGMGRDRMAPPPLPGDGGGTNMEELYNQMPLPTPPTYRMPSPNADEFSTRSMDRMDMQQGNGTMQQLMEFFSGGSEI